MSFSFPFLKVALHNAVTKPSTVLYPFVPVEVAPDYRGRIAYDGDKCINCGMCVKVCSPAAITRTEVETPEGKDITYEFDLTSCTFCGTCQDFCDQHAITLTQDFHMASTDKADLITTGVCHKKMPKGKLTVNDNCVYCTLCAKKCPEGAITVDRENKTWSVDDSKCTKCGTCIATCRKGALAFESKEPEVQFVPENCVYCTLCAKKCPVGAITVDRENKTWTIDREACIKCGACVANCRKGALKME